MTERISQMEKAPIESALERNLRHLDADLDIMERHSAEMSRVEENIQASMRKWDREFKDDHLHSIPRPIKHRR